MFDCFQKVLSLGVLSSDDLTAEDKKRLFQLMTDRGASESFAYTRFFRDGFAKWEIEGILRLKVKYLDYLHCVEKIHIEHRLADTVKTPDGESCRYLTYYPTPDGERSFDMNVPGQYWEFLGNIRYRTRFAAWMQQHGMMSEVTVRKRFSTDDWCEYERIGIRQIIEAFTGEYALSVQK